MNVYRFTDNNGSHMGIYRAESEDTAVETMFKQWNRQTVQRYTVENLGTEPWAAPDDQSGPALDLRQWAKRVP